MRTEPLKGSAAVSIGKFCRPFAPEPASGEASFGVPPSLARRVVRGPPVLGGGEAEPAVRVDRVPLYRHAAHTDDADAVTRVARDRVELAGTRATDGHGTPLDGDARASVSERRACGAVQSDDVRGDGDGAGRTGRHQDPRAA